MSASATGDTAGQAPPLESDVVDLCGGYKRASGNRTKKRKKPPPASSGKIDAIVVDPFARRVKESPAAIYKRVLGPLRMEFVESFSTEHSFMKTHAPATKTNLVRLMHELVEYQLNLPIMETGSIFVRALESRCDLLRCLVTGPSGTPYEHGCFLFDVHLHDYPHQAPRVKFLTTGGGRVRFNPNLYNCGKVCLSLLGTWQGPGWISNKSSLLQVLVSIQGLILVEDPYFNEPSYEQTRGSTSGKNKSDAYNRNIRIFTLTHAFPLERTSRYYPEFDEVIEEHYYQRAPQVIQQLQQWDTLDASLKARTAVLRPFFDNFMKQREADSAPKPPEVVDLLDETPSTTMKKQHGATGRTDNSEEIIDLLD